MKRSAQGWIRAGMVFSLVLGGSTWACGQRPAENPSYPVYHIAKNKNDLPTSNHSLDPALKIAQESLVRIREGIQDYSAIIVKRERVNNVLGPHEFMFAKVRNRKTQNGQIAIPFSVYLAFLKPEEIKGREVLFVEGRNNGNLMAREGGLKRMLGVMNLAPTGSLAMMGQRYPITDIGLENLTVKLIERGERDKAHGDCKVEFDPDPVKVSGRPCTVVRVTHPEKVAPYDFHIAEVFIDNEMRIPVRYAAYNWPASVTSDPEVIEEYTYQNIKINNGFSDADFDPANANYNFKR